MIFSDLITMRRGLAQLLGIMAIVCCLMALSMETLAPVAACVASMIPIMFVFGICAYDEMNMWEGFRLTMPMSRRDVVAGRYLSLLAVALLAFAFGIALSFLLTLLAAVFAEAMGENSLLSSLILENNPPEMIVGSAAMGLAVMLVMASVSLPLTMRFGITRASRVLPLAVVLIIVAVLALVSPDGALSGMLPQGVQRLFASDAGFLMLTGASLAAALALFAASGFVSARFYATREL